MTKEVTDGLERLLKECEDSEQMAVAALSESELQDAEGFIEAWDDCRKLTGRVREALALARFEFSKSVPTPKDGDPVKRYGVFYKLDGAEYRSSLCCLSYYTEAEALAAIGVAIRFEPGEYAVGGPRALYTRILKACDAMGDGTA